MALSPVCLGSLGGKIVKILTQEHKKSMSYDSRHRLKPLGSKSGNRKEDQEGAGRGCLPPTPTQDRPGGRPYQDFIEDFRARR